MKIKHMTILTGVLAALGVSAAANAQVVSVAANAEPYCREFQQTFTIGGKTQKGYGTACLQPDGSWEIQKPATTTVVQQKTVTTVQTQPTIQYVVQQDRVFVVPPEPFVVGTILIGGRPHRFEPDFRPVWRPEMHEWHPGAGYGHGEGPAHGWRH